MDTVFYPPALGSQDLVGGDAPQTQDARTGKMGHSGEHQAEPQAKIVLRPIIGLTKGLPKSTLESIVIEAIRKHRFLRDIAEMRHAESNHHPGPDGSVTAPAAAYVRAMIDLHAQQTVLSTLLDVLGYVPEVPAE